MNAIDDIFAAKKAPKQGNPNVNQPKGKNNTAIEAKALKKGTGKSNSNASEPKTKTLEDKKRKAAKEVIEQSKKTKPSASKTPNTAPVQVVEFKKTAVKKQELPEDELFKPKRRTMDDGLPIYKEDELNIGLGKDTADCPFDCDCCF